MTDNDFAALKDRVTDLERRVAKLEPSPAPAEPPPITLPVVEPPSSPSLQLFEHANFGGHWIVNVDAVTNYHDVSFNDRASSAIAVGDWEAFEHANFQGRRLAIGNGWHSHLALNDAISSARPVQAQPAARKGLYFGYFGSDDDQVDETADHVNLLFAAFGSDAQLAARIAKAAMPTILDVSDCLFTTDGNPRHYRGNQDAGDRVVKRMAAMAAVGGVFPHIVALYVIDEPERESNVSAEEIKSACALLRQLSPGIALHICYGDGDDLRGAEYADWIGVNDYDGDWRSRVRYAKERHPDKRIVLYPGGADPWRNDPAPFYEFAQANPEVIAIVPFIWLAEHHGIKINGMADAYRTVGKLIKEAA